MVVLNVEGTQLGLLVVKDSKYFVILANESNLQVQLEVHETFFLLVFENIVPQLILKLDHMQLVKISVHVGYEIILVVVVFVVDVND